ncbi:SDH family Clp fold serine proteinase [Mesorhizobium sp. ISC15]|uniref:SDH family Clp fold serine proteinase n=1 Tax=Mesorhizobium sp. ISC15 TaxID=3076429 RepID=UPI00301BB361
MAVSKKGKSQLEKISQQAVKESGRDIYLYAGEISEAGYIRLAQEIVGNVHSREVTLILVTAGGSGSAAFKIARLLQNHYKDFQIFVPAYCKSAGTVVALGAHMILMTSMSELGPIDSQVLEQDAIGMVGSSLCTRASLDSLFEASFDFFEDSTIRLVQKSQGSISFKLAAEISAMMATSMVSSLVAKIDPVLLGKHRREDEEGIKYGLLLAEVSENAKDGTVQKLTTDYPKHDFVIDRMQAEQLFHNVEEPSQTLKALAALPDMQVLYGTDGPPVVRSFHKTTIRPSNNADPHSRAVDRRKANDDQPSAGPVVEDLKAA